MALVETRGLAFLNEMDDWLSNHEIGAINSTDTRDVRMGVGVYLIHDDNE